MKFNKLFETVLSIKSLLSKYLLHFFVRMRLASFNSYYVLFISLILAGTLYKNIHDPMAQTSLPDCASLSDSVDADPGNNCQYQLGGNSMPLCIGSNTDNRINCLDPIDLPICDIISEPSQRRNLKNCILQCDDPVFDSGEAPVHNVNCIRLCSPGNSDPCVDRKCHQYSLDGQTDDFPQTCAGSSLERCDRLWPSELMHWSLIMFNYYNDISNGGRFEYDQAAETNSVPLYCNNVDSNDQPLKCHSFSEEALQNLSVVPSENAPCIQHNCSPSPDFDIIDAKSDSFKLAYNQVFQIFSPGTTEYLTGEDQYSCVRLPPPPPNLNIQRYCTDADGRSDVDAQLRTVPHRQCSGSCDGNGFCSFSVDCSQNPTHDSCPEPPAPEPINTISADNHSWFHRPFPSSKATFRDGNVTRVDRNIGGNAELCVSKNWRAVRRAADGSNSRGRYRSINTLLFGTWHFFYYDLFHTSISPGVCRTPSAGHRGTGYIYLKGPNGWLYNSVSTDTMYHDSEVITTFDGEAAIHSLRICTRFRNTVCVQCEGERECVPTASSTLIRPWWTQACGHDLCRSFTIRVDPNEPDPRTREGHACMFDSERASMDGDCSSTFDTYLRMRAVFHRDDNSGNEYVCGYLDAKGHLGYEPHRIRPSNASEHIDAGNPLTPCRAKSEYVRLDGGVYDCSDDGFTSGSVWSREFSDSGSDVRGEGADERSRSNRADQADVWRNVLKAIYVGNNQPSESPLQGYYDADNNFHHKLHCAPVRKRVGSIFYNVATAENSPTILNPPVRLISVVSNDFFRPEIKARFGVAAVTSFADGGGPNSNYSIATDTQNPRNRSIVIRGLNEVFLSLDPTEIDGFSEYGTAQAAASRTIYYAGGVDATIDGISRAYTYVDSQIPSVGERVTTEVFLRKSFDFSVGRPNFCLYQRTKDANGQYSENPFRVGCRYRSEPSGRVVINYNNNISELYMVVPQHMVPPHMSGLTTDQSRINVLDVDRNYCSTRMEQYNVCLRRDLCTKLARECPSASVARSEAIGSNSPTVTFDSIINNCEGVVKPYCLELRGLDPDSTTPDIDIIETNEYGATRCRNEDSEYLQGVLFDPDNPDQDYDLRPCEDGEDPFKYGWFSEAYVSLGFSEQFAYKVLAHRTNDGSMGICQLDVTNSTNLTDQISVTDPDTGRRTRVPNLATHCLGGGNNNRLVQGDCKCRMVPENYVMTPDESRSFTLRRPTAREAGFSMEIPYTRVCSFRAGINLPNQSGENFSSVFVGTRSVGTCDASRGWVERKDMLGNNLYPSLSCVDDRNNPQTDDAVFTDELDRSDRRYAGIRNACIRRSCNQISVADPNYLGEYFGAYDINEQGECRGYRNGYANWPTYVPDPDPAADPLTFIQAASSCISGFKPMNSSPQVNSSGVITGYTGGSLPHRICLLNGNFGDLTDESIDSSDTTCGAPSQSAIDAAQTKGCVRITCSATNPPIPADISDTAAWALWFQNGGARYPEVLASRSSNIIFDESKAYGTCENSLGFSQPPASNARPYYECDHLGNKGPIENACIRIACDGVTTDADSNNINHGYAKWDAVTDQQMINEMRSTGQSVGSLSVPYSGRCHPGYVTNPYSPRFNELGVPLTPQQSANMGPQPPRRFCLAGYDTAGNLIKIWRKAWNPCVNSCPGGKDNLGRTVSQIQAQINQLEQQQTSGTLTSAEVSTLETLRTNLLTLDDRIGIGRTTHNVTRNVDASGSVTVSWPSANIGDVVYETNMTNPSNLDASMFTEDGNHDVYLLKRRCGSDGRWEDPVPSCSANGGIIHGAIMNVPGVAQGEEANSIRSYTLAQRSAEISSGSAGFEFVTGQCTVDQVISNPVERARIENLLLNLPNSQPVLYCRRDDDNINSVYYDLHDPASTFCGTCPANFPTAEINVPGYANSPITSRSLNRRYYPGERVAASCNDNNNYALQSSIPPLPGPFVECDSSGSAQWIGYDVDHCKRSCTLRASHMLSKRLTISPSSCSSDVTYSMTSQLAPGQEVKIRHGERFEFNAYNSCRLSYNDNLGFGPGVRNFGICKVWRYSSRCVDGSFQVNERMETSFDRCTYSEYNYRTNRWDPNPSVRLEIPSPNQFVAYLHLPRTQSFNSGMGMMKTNDDFQSITLNCRGCPSSSVMARAFTPGSIPRGITTNSNFHWDDADQNTNTSTRIDYCTDYRYFGQRDVRFNIDQGRRYNQGEEVVGRCGSASTLRPGSPPPKIVCQSNGMWSLVNESSCRMSFNSGTSEVLRLIADTSQSHTRNLCPNAASRKLYLAPNILIPDGSDFGFNYLYRCQSSEPFDTDTYVSIRVNIRVNDGQIFKNFNGASTVNAYNVAEYQPQAGWSGAYGAFHFIGGGPLNYAIEVRRVDMPTRVPSSLNTLFSSSNGQMSGATSLGINRGSFVYPTDANIYNQRFSLYADPPLYYENRNFYFAPENYPPSP